MNVLLAAFVLLPSILLVAMVVNLLFETLFDFDQ
jgi:hypothetical protein